MKIIALIVALLATTVSSVSAAPVSTEYVCPEGATCGPGGALFLVSKTTGKLEYVSQCFPWVWLYEYRAGNLVNMYSNQKACQEKRHVDFGI